MALPALKVQSSKFNVPSSKFKVPSSKINVPSSKFNVPSSKFDVPSSKFQVPRSTFQVQRLFCLFFSFLVKPFFASEGKFRAFLAVFLLKPHKSTVFFPHHQIFHVFFHAYPILFVDEADEN